MSYSESQSPCRVHNNSKCAVRQASSGYSEYEAYLRGNFTISLVFKGVFMCTANTHLLTLI